MEHCFRSKLDVLVSHQQSCGVRVELDSPPWTRMYVDEVEKETLKIKTEAQVRKNRPDWEMLKKEEQNFLFVFSKFLPIHSMSVGSKTRVLLLFACA